MSLIGRINAVQLILTLNVLYSLTDKNLSSEERKEKVVLCADNFVDKIVDDQLMQLLIIWTPLIGMSAGCMMIYGPLNVTFVHMLQNLSAP